MQSGAPAGAEDPTLAERPNSEQACPRILLVDDEYSVLRVGALLLRSRGFWVKAVVDGALAWEALAAERFDLLITDQKMPLMSGVELLRKMHAEGVRLPVVMVTAAEPFDELKRLPAVQPSVMLLKPYTADEMLAAVRAALLQ